MVHLLLVLLYGKYLFKVGRQTDMRSTKNKYVFVLLYKLDNATMKKCSTFVKHLFHIFLFFLNTPFVYYQVQSFILPMRQWENKDKNQTTKSKILFLFFLTLAELQNLFLVNLKTCAKLNQICQWMKILVFSYKILDLLTDKKIWV